jgi:hypothetical protein
MSRRTRWDCGVAAVVSQNKDEEFRRDDDSQSSKFAVKTAAGHKSTTVLRQMWSWDTFGTGDTLVIFCLVPLIWIRKRT